MHHPPLHTVGRAIRPPRAARRRRGLGIVEALVALALLVVGVAAVGAASAAGVRAARRARLAERADALVRDRVTAWSARPATACVPMAGVRDEPPLRERWQVDTADGVARLLDSVAPLDGGVWPRAGMVAVAACVGSTP